MNPLLLRTNILCQSDIHIRVVKFKNTIASEKLSNCQLFVLNYLITDTH